MCAAQDRIKMRHQTKLNTRKRSALHLTEDEPFAMQFPPLARERKRVRFSTAIASTTNSESECASNLVGNADGSCPVHWQSHDYKTFRVAAQQIASEVMKITAAQAPSALSYDAVLTRVIEVCAMSKDEACTPIDNVEDSNHSTCLPRNLFQLLTHWVKSGHIRGLEKHCVLHHMLNRPLERKASIEAVIIAQHLLAKARSNEKLNKNIDGGSPGTVNLGSWKFSLSLPDDEIMRMASERFTSTARRFGTAMGHADAAALGNFKYHPEKSADIAPKLS